MNVLKKDENVSENPTGYKEKKWSKDGEFFSGYSFRGGRLFNKVVVGIKDLFIKGKENELGNLKFKALDVKQKGAGTEIDVELMKNGNRGVAIVKLYGPNAKKENVVMVTK